VTAFSNLGMRVLRTLKLDKTSNPQLSVALLFGRALTSLQSVVILAERGLSADSRTVLRSAAETTIVLNAVAVDVTVTDLLVLRHQWHRRKLLTSWLNDPVAVAEMTDGQRATFAGEVATIDATHPAVKKLGKDPIVIHDLAVRTGLLALYNAVYRPTSGDAAHASLFALDRHVRADAAAAIQGLTFGPSTLDLPSTLHASISAFAPAIKRLSCSSARRSLTANSTVAQLRGRPCRFDLALVAVAQSPRAKRRRRRACPRRSPAKIHRVAASSCRRCTCREAR
jgi:hypothetical protein